MEQTPGLADVRLAKDDARPELALRVDRDKAALLGLTVNQVATTVRTNIAGTQAAFYRERGREYPIVVRLRPEDRQRVDNVNDVLVSTPTGRLVQAKSLMRVDNERGPVEIERKNLERVNRVNAELDGTLGDAVDNVNARARPAARPARLHRRVRRRGRGAGQGLHAAPLAAAARGDPGLRGDGVAVRVAARPVHHHVLDPAGLDRRGAGAEADRHRVQPAGLHRRHHAGRHRGQQRHPAGRLHDDAAHARQDAAAARPSRPPAGRASARSS